jgi:hypothetical protein
MDQYQKEVPGAEVDKDQHPIMKGFRRWSLYFAGAVAVLFAGFLFWGWMTPSSTTQTASVGRTVITNVNTACLQPKHDVVFGYEKVVFNRGGACGPDLWHDGHCLYVLRAASSGDPTKYRHCGGTLPKDAESAWTADTPFVGAVALGPPRY